MKKTLVTLSISALLLCMVISVSFAGTTVITVEKDTDHVGAVEKDAGNLTNLNGAMVWNGKEWVVNNSWAHMYFSDLRTGKRLVDRDSFNVSTSASTSTDVANQWNEFYKKETDYNAYLAAKSKWDSDYAKWLADPNSNPNPGTAPTAVPAPTVPGQNLYGEAEAPIEIGGYTITKQTYSYSIADAAGNTYTYQGIEYTVEQPDGTKIVLKSRGSGNGGGDGQAADQSYFNIYVENKGGTVTALRGDPVWFTYNADINTAKNMMDGVSSSNKTGDLPTNNANYYMDVKGGSDMGGVTYKMTTSTVNAKTNNLGSTFATGFSIQFLNSSTNKIQEINFTPSILNETITPKVTPSCCC